MSTAQLIGAHATSGVGALLGSASGAAVEGGPPPSVQAGTVSRVNETAAVAIARRCGMPPLHAPRVPPSRASDSGALRAAGEPTV